MAQRPQRAVAEPVVITLYLGSSKSDLDYRERNSLAVQLEDLIVVIDAKRIGIP
jgi:hypothetical protein